MGTMTLLLCVTVLVAAGWVLQVSQEWSSKFWLRPGEAPPLHPWLICLRQRGQADPRQMLKL